jgi:hypothetical protein
VTECLVNQGVGECHRSGSSCSCREGRVGILPSANREEPLMGWNAWPC